LLCCSQQMASKNLVRRFHEYTVELLNCRLIRFAIIDILKYVKRQEIR